MVKAHIVWNEARNEGVIFKGGDASADAYQTATRNFGTFATSLGEAFAELYDDHEFSTQVVDIPEPA